VQFLVLTVASLVLAYALQVCLQLGIRWMKALIAALTHPFVNEVELALLTMQLLLAMFVTVWVLSLCLVIVYG
jgi:hypothetical protein